MSDTTTRATCSNCGTVDLMDAVVYNVQKAELIRLRARVAELEQQRDDARHLRHPHSGPEINCQWLINWKIVFALFKRCRVVHLNLHIQSIIQCITWFFSIFFFHSSSEFFGNQVS